MASPTLALRVNADTSAAQKALNAAGSSVKQFAATAKKVGDIKVNADTKNAEAGLARAETAARQIDGLTPDVKVDADTSKAESALEGLGTKVAALGIGAAIGAGIAETLNVDAMNAKLNASLGLTARQSARAGQVAGTLYSQNYGENLGQINEAIGLVIRDIDGMRTASEASLGRISTKVLNTAGIFDQDLGGVTRAVSQMMRTGLAKDADQALDIITAGFQAGVDKSEDFLDTLNEYGTQFRKMGLDGKTATGLLQQGLQAGARDADVVADAIKEFSIRAVDGSKTTREGFKALGLQAEDMAEQFSQGGPAAEKGLDQVLTKLRNIESPARRAMIATKLFGTQAEDLGDALFALDPSSAAKGLGKVAGAADKANTAFNDTPTAQLQAFVRQIKGGLLESAKRLIPVVNRVAPVFVTLGNNLDKIALIVGPLVAAWALWTVAMKVHAAATAAWAGVQTAAATASKLMNSTFVLRLRLLAMDAAAWVRSTAAVVAHTVVTKTAAAATKAWAAVQAAWNAIMLLNPIVLIVAGIVALIAIIAIVVQKTIGWGNVWKAVQAAIGVAWDFIKTTVSKGFELIKNLFLNFTAVGLFIKHWNTIKKTTQTAITAVVGFIRTLPARAREILVRFVTAYTTPYRRAFEIARNVVTNGISAVVGFLRNLPGRARDALSALTERVRTIFDNAMGAGRDKVTTIGGQIVEWIKGIPGKVLAAAGKFTEAGKTLGSNILSAFKTAISGAVGQAWDVGAAVKSAINSAMGLPKFIGGTVLGKKVGVTIPAFAQGGIISGPTLALIGEAGPEAVVPLRETGSIKFEGAAGGGPVELSDASIEKLARAILAGAAQVSQGTMTRQARRIIGAPA